MFSRVAVAATRGRRIAVNHTFNGFSVDLDALRLIGPDGPIHLEPQVFDVLSYLLRHNGRVVPKTELFDEVWKSRFVSESALSSRIKTLRSALGDNGRDQHTIRTAHGRGFQFVADLAELAAQPTVGAPVEPSRRGHSLPKIRDQLHGRDRDLADLRQLVSEERLTTILGPGGTGKTRLSVELGVRCAEETLVAFVDLAAVRTAVGLRQALAQSLGVQAGQHDNVLAACTAYLRSRQALLIVDNCEHIVDAASELVTDILSDTTTTTILATSRVPLGLRDEMVFRLSPLPVLLKSDHLDAKLTSENAAAALFLDRVRRVERKFTLTDENCGVVVSLCQALDGLPLALELAASRMSVFTIEDLIDRLDRRLDLLHLERSETDERHHSLRAMLDWSYELLGDDQQQMLRVLSVFPAGITLDGAEWLGSELRLASDPLDVLTQLVEASLLTRRDTKSGSRYRQLETMRTFGIEQLELTEESEHAADLAVKWSLHLVATVPDGMKGASEARFDDLIRQEIPNLRSARRRLLDHRRMAELIQLSADLDEWSQLRDVSEIWSWSDELIDFLPELNDDDAAKVHAMVAQSRWRRGRIEDSLRHSSRAHDLSEEGSWARNRSLTALGTSQLFSGQLDAAADSWTRSWLAGGNPFDEANAALAIAYGGDIDSGLARARSVMDVADHSGYPTSIAWTHYITGEILSLTNANEARELLETAERLADGLGASFIVGVAGVTIATRMLGEGDNEAAAGKFASLIEHWLKSGTWTQLWTTLRHSARLIADSEPELALALIDMSALDPHSPQLDEAARSDEDAFVTSLKTRIGADDDGLPMGAGADRSELADLTRRALLMLAES